MKSIKKPIAILFTLLLTAGVIAPPTGSEPAGVGQALVCVMHKDKPILVASPAYVFHILHGDASCGDTGGSL